MGVIGNLARRAGIGGSTLDVIEELEKHPEALALGPLGVGAYALNAMHPGMGVHRPGLGITSPHPLPAGLTHAPHPVKSLIAAMEATGQSVEGLQPWHVSGYKNIASGTVIAANADITDMFTSANTRLFGTDDTFPWTFLARRFRCALVTEPVDPATEDAAWDRQLSLRFVVATEIGRISLPGMGCEFVIEGPLSGSGGGTAAQIFPAPGVNFPVVFQKNGTYQMWLHTDFPITTTKASAFSYQMDGWVVQNTGLLSDGAAIQNALGGLIGQGQAQALMNR